MKKKSNRISGVAKYNNRNEENHWVDSHTGQKESAN